MVVNLLHFLDARHVNLQSALGLTDALKRKHHVVCSERRSIMEFNVFAQIETHDGGAGVGPAGGQ